MSSYVHITAQELQLGDHVRRRGRVVREVVDHETREGFVTVIFLKEGQENITIMPADVELQVRVESDFA